MNILAEYIKDSSALVRNSAVSANVNLQMESSNSRFDSALADSVFAVRLGAARGLTGIAPLDVTIRLRNNLNKARNE